jgi:hypothetical protein
MSESHVSPDGDPANVGRFSDNGRQPNLMVDASRAPSCVYRERFVFESVSGPSNIMGHERYIGQLERNSIETHENGSTSNPPNIHITYTSGIGQCLTEFVWT